MRYAFFPALWILCAGCGTLAGSGAASMDEAVSESIATPATPVTSATPVARTTPITPITPITPAAMSTVVDNTDSSFVHPGRLPEPLKVRAAAQKASAANIPEAGFPGEDRQEVSLLPTEPDAGAGYEPTHQAAAPLPGECGADCNDGLRWINRSGFIDYMVPVLFDLIDWGGGRLIRALSGSKAKPARSSRKRGGRSVREADRSRPERKPNKRSSRGQGRR